MKKKFSKRIVKFSIGTVLLYTIVAIVYQFITHEALDSTLTTCVYTFFGGEMLALAGIKVSEVIKSQGDIVEQGEQG